MIRHILFWKYTDSVKEEHREKEALETAEKEAIRRGEALGMERGMAKGMMAGEERMAKLFSMLYEAGRAEDVKRALSDLSYRKLLFEEFEL